MRPLRIDMVTERLEGGRPEVLKGNDIHSPSIRFEGSIPGGGTRTFPLRGSRPSTLVLRNGSSIYAVTIVVRDADDAIIATFFVVANSDALVPIDRLGRSIEFLNESSSNLPVLALFF